MRSIMTWRLGAAKKTRKPAAAQKHRRLGVEALEDRRFLSASPHLGAAAVVPGAAVSAITSEPQASSATAPGVSTPAGNSSLVVVNVSSQHQVFAVGQDHQVWTESFNGTSWNVWTRTQAGLVQQISAQRDAAGQLNIYGLGMDNQVWFERLLADGTWSSWTLTQHGTAKSIATQTTVAPGAASQVFIVGSDNQVWSETTTANGWGGWTLTQRGAVKQISALMDSTGETHVFAIGMDNQVWYLNALGKNTFSAWNFTQPGAVQAIATPAVAQSKGPLQVFAIGTDGQVWTESSGNGWHGWKLTQAGPARALSAINTGTGTSSVVIVGTDHQVYSETVGSPSTPWLITWPAVVQ